MNKKKALVTSLAALALAATANTSFAEEVDATVAEPVVAEVPATEEVAQDAPVAEVAQEEPVAEAVAEEVPAVEAPAEETAPVSETPAEEPVAAASAGVVSDDKIFTETLEVYKEFLEAPGTDILRVQSAHSELSLNPEAKAQPSEIEYLYYDINNDGQNELLIGAYHDKDFSNFAGFTSPQGIEAIGQDSSTSLKFNLTGRLYNIYSSDDSGRVENIFAPAGGRLGTILMEDGSIWSYQNNGSTITPSIIHYIYDSQAKKYVEAASYMVEGQNSTYNTYPEIYSDLKTGKDLTSDELTALLNTSKPFDFSAIEKKSVLSFVAPLNATEPVAGTTPAVEVAPAEEPVAQPVVEESTPVETAVSATDAILANDFSPIAGQWATADGKTLEVSSTGIINLSDGRTYTVYGTAQGSDSAGISFVMPIAGFGISYHPGVDEITTGNGTWGSVPDVYKRVAQPAVQETPTPVSTGLVGTWAGESADGLPGHVAQVDQIVIAEDGSYTIYQTNRNTGAKEEKVGQITSMEQIGENRYLITETGGLSGIYSPGFVTANKVETGLEIFADKFGVFYIITDVQTGEKTETAPIRYLTRVTPAVETPVVTETGAPTTAEVVHVPLTAKTESAYAPAQQSYSRTEKAQAEKTAQSEKGILPSTGEAVSMLGLVGAGLSALGLAGLRRRNK